MLTSPCLILTILCPSSKLISNLSSDPTTSDSLIVGAANAPAICVSNRSDQGTLSRFKCDLMMIFRYLRPVREKKAGVCISLKARKGRTRCSLNSSHRSYSLDRRARNVSVKPTVQLPSRDIKSYAFLSEDAGNIFRTSAGTFPRSSGGRGGRSRFSKNRGYSLRISS